uniref:SH2 domain-containing protein n=2 Tax=Graphocephala atropunctata TaxID=36148 RepID=A0A1B6KIR7_9HEMI
MTFQSVDEMVRYYEREPLILYSGGELTGRTKLKAPPPGLVRSKRSSATSNAQLVDSRRNSSLNGGRRTSEGEDLCSSTDLRGPPTACSRTLSSGHVEVPFSSAITRRLANSAPEIELGNASGLSSSPRKVSSESLPQQPPALPPRPSHLVSSEEYRRGSVPSSSKETTSRADKIRNASVHNRPLPSIPGEPGEHAKDVPPLNLSMVNSPIAESTSL